MLVFGFIWLGLCIVGTTCGLVYGYRSGHGHCPCGKYGTVQLHNGQWRCIRHVVDERPMDITQVIKL